MYKKLLIFLFLSISTYLASQEILTAEDYLDSVSQKANSIKDYQADLTILQNGIEMTGKLYYKAPDFIRIDFSLPEGLVISIDDDDLRIYLPQYAVELQQSLPADSKTTISTMVKQQGQGLIYLINNYAVAYSVGPDRIPLDETHEEELVIKLLFLWKSSAEGFKEFEISFDNNNLIRRITGKTVQDEVVQFDFENIVINLGLEANIFHKMIPDASYIYENFLSEDD